MTEDTILDVDYFGAEKGYTDREVSRINEEYDAYICPLADAFRDDFEEKLRKITSFIEKLTIPCYVVGVGLRAPYEPEIGAPRPFDDAVKEFVKAVLNKSSTIGVRGEITGEYLIYLGFKEDVDYVAIGCPSLYTFGGNLPQRPLQLDRSSRIAFNLGSTAAEDIKIFVLREIQRYNNHYLIEQDLWELRLLYYGLQY